MYRDRYTYGVKQNTVRYYGYGRWVQNEYGGVVCYDNRCLTCLPIYCWRENSCTLLAILCLRKI